MGGLCGENTPRVLPPLVFSGLPWRLVPSHHGIWSSTWTLGRKYGNCSQSTYGVEKYGRPRGEIEIIR